MGKANLINLIKGFGGQLGCVLWHSKRLLELTRLGYEAADLIKVRILIRI